jgi:hypothetical protein
MADCVLLVEGYDAKAIASLPDHELGATVLRDRGAKPEAIAGVYRLDFALTGVDLRVPDRRRMA